MPSSTNASRTPGRCLHLVEVGAHDRAAEYRALRVRRVQHAGQLHVDAEQRLARDDLLIVDAGHARAEELEVLGILERRVRRRRERRGLRRELAVRRAALRRRMNHGALLRRALAGRHAPRLRGGGDEHRARGCAGAAERREVRDRRPLPTDDCRPYAGFKSPCTTVTCSHGTSSSSATIIGSDVLMPCPISEFGAMIDDRAARRNADERVRREVVGGDGQRLGERGRQRQSADTCRREGRRRRAR